MTGWKLVPVEPTEEMFAAMQTAGLAAWDAVMASELNNDLPTYPETYARQQAWTAALDAAPDAPSAEPYAWHYWNTGGGSVLHRGPSNNLDADMQAAKDYPRVHHVTPLYATPPDHRAALAASEASDAESIAMYRRCRDDRDKLREIMRQAIEALRDAHAYSVMHEEFRDGVLNVIDALRAALGEKR
jgi:hypothetical protein